MKVFNLSPHILCLNFRLQKYTGSDLESKTGQIGVTQQNAIHQSASVSPDSNGMLNWYRVVFFQILSF